MRRYKGFFGSEPIFIFIGAYTLQLIPIMIFHSYQQKPKKSSTHKTGTSFGTLSKSQSFRNTEQSAKGTNGVCSLRTILKNTAISRPKDKCQPKVSSLVKMPLYMRLGLQSKLKKRTVKKEQVRDNLFDSLDLSASIWCLYDAQLKKHVGFREDCKREIASLTKIMTTIVSIEIIERLSIPLDLKVKITAVSKSMIGTSAGLKPNYWITLHDLLYGVMLPSGNDAAYSVAEYLGFVLMKSYIKISWLDFDQPLDLTKYQTIFYVQQFIRAMNNKAKELKLTSTCFSNPHGLSNAMNTSSAKDLIKISRHSVKNSKFRQIMNTKLHQYSLYQSEITKTILGSWKNTNVLLEKGWQGVKTGHTPSAGGCLSSLKDGIYIVILNSQNDETRFSDTQKIYNWYKKRTQTSSLKTTIKRAVSQAAESKEGKEGKQFSIRYKPITQLSDYA